MIKSKALDICDTSYIFCNFYKSHKKEWYQNVDDLIHDDDDDDDDDYGAVYGDGNNPYVITDLELEV